MTRAATDPLLEREREEAVIDDLLATVQDEAAGMIIEGFPGIGKSRLLATARRSAAGRMRVLHARGCEMDRDVTFSMARQLLEPVLREAGERERSDLLDGAGRLALAVLGDPGEESAAARAVHREPPRLAAPHGRAERRPGGAGGPARVLGGEHPVERGSRQTVERQAAPASGA